MRIRLLLAISIGALIISAGGLAMLAQGEWIHGVVSHKSVVGSIYEVSTTLITVTPTSVIVNPAVEDIIHPDGTDFVLTDDMERALRNSGYTLTFVGNVRPETRDDVNNLEPGSTTGMYCTKDVFNKLVPNDHISYQATYLAPMHIVDVHT